MIRILQLFFVYLSDVAKGAERILPHRFGGLHPQMLLVATRTSHIRRNVICHLKKITLNKE